MKLLTLIFASQCFAATYYVDQTAGSDGAAGTSTGTAWKTLAKVNGSTFSAGDSVLLKCGETWREKLVPPSSGSVGNSILFGSYGTCTGVNRPLILGSDLITGWTVHSGSVYKVTSINWYAKMVFSDAVKLTPVASLGAIGAGKFFLDDAADTLYVQLSGSDNPSGHAMEVSVRGDVQITGPGGYYFAVDGLVRITNTIHDISFDNLELRYSNWYGFWIHGSAGNIVINNCVGTYLFSNFVVTIGTTQGGAANPAGIYLLGNTAAHGGYGRSDVGGDNCGVGLHCGHEGVNLDSPDGFSIANNSLDDWYAEGFAVVFAAKNGSINYNTVTNQNLSGAIYITGSSGKTADNIEMAYNLVDTGTNGNSITAILASIEGTGVINNARIHHNVVRNWPNGYAFILANDGNAAAAVTNTLFYNNTASGVKFGILFTTNSNYVNNTFQNNIIAATEGAGNAIEISGTAGTNNTVNYNQYYCPGNPNFAFIWIGGGPGTFAAYQSATGQDAHGAYGDPVFTSSTDLSLQTSSPAKNRGVDLGSTYNLGLNPSSAWPNGIFRLSQAGNGTAWEKGAYVFPEVKRPVRVIRTN